jgi:hypothetical protein
LEVVSGPPPSITPLADQRAVILPPSPLRLPEVAWKTAEGKLSLLDDRQGMHGVTQEIRYQSLKAEDYWSPSDELQFEAYETGYLYTPDSKIGHFR